MTNDRKAANALSGKTARACDGCSRKRARWFCAADDAFLCQACDDSVHSANQLASRHERVRLETASSKISGSRNTVDSVPAWHQGFIRKARTPRNSSNKQQLKDEDKVLVMNPLPLVPEIGGEEEGNSTFADEDDDRLLYRVPVFDPYASELCTDDMVTCGEGTEITMGNEEGNIVFDGYNGQEGTCDDLDILPEFFSSDMDLAEFAADVENLLGVNEDSPDIEDLCLLHCKEEEDDQKCFFDDQDKVVMKVKDEQEVEACDHFDQAFERESLDWSFNYESPTITADEVEEKKRVPVAINSQQKKETKSTASLLRLNYEDVINAWASQGSPWTSGSRPELNSDDCWPDCMDICLKDGHHHPYGGMGGHTRGGNGAREARVLRYKEKRRTRLFSKKIRYEVRKLNAEKRPRMKGRFVKRTSFMGNGFPYMNK
ncbi:transcription factor, putative [Ricinus communis]|uniref:Transcription factor, putative n=1 Tax=Ricinus communis TaxID=3988 RepID=B9T593_RICCO|nr:transcription factor, putative [Ricinus communis]|eukprot:XP_002533412.1 zinc finger protein CONSTANS-LIKE 6 [Ricinus communis]